MAITKDEFRSFMGTFAAGVTVVTTQDADGKHWGLTATAFSSLSLDPPLCLVCINHNAGSYETFKKSGKYAVNVLSDQQEELSNRFASKRDDKFDGIPWESGAVTGCPVLADTLASIECTVHEILPGGDHDIFIGAIQNVKIGQGKPLVYWGGAYGDVTSRPKKW